MSSQIVPSRGNGEPARRVETVFDSMRREIDTIFDRVLSPSWSSSLGPLGRLAMVGDPRMDMSETEKEYVVEAELPGVDQKDVAVTLQNGMLSIRGQKKQEHEEKSGNFYLSERSFGSFERAVRLPEAADEAKVEASFKDGVLRIAIAKRAGAVKPVRTIEIKKA